MKCAALKTKINWRIILLSVETRVKSDVSEFCDEYLATYVCDYNLTNRANNRFREDCVQGRIRVRVGRARDKKTVSSMVHAMKKVYAMLPLTTEEKEACRSTCVKTTDPYYFCPIWDQNWARVIEKSLAVVSSSEES